MVCGIGVEKKKDYIEHGGCVDIEEASEEAVIRLMDNLMRKFTRFFQYKEIGVPTLDYGFAFAYSSEGHLIYICSILSGHVALGRSIPSLKERLEEKGYYNILLLDSASLLRFAKKRRGHGKKNRRGEANTGSYRGDTGGQKV